MQEDHSIAGLNKILGYSPSLAPELNHLRLHT